MSFTTGRLLQLISQIVLTRLLSPRDFGIWAIVLVISSFSALFRDYCIAQVLVQKGIENRRFANAVFSLGVNVSIALFLTQAILALPLSYFFHEPLICPLTIATSLTFLIGAGTGSHTAVLQYQLKFKELGTCDSLTAFARSATTIVCACFGLGVWSFAIGEILLISAESILKRKYSGYRFHYHFQPDSKIISEIRSFVVNILSSRIAAQINSNSDNLVVGRFMGATQLGYYGLAFQIAVLPSQALIQICRVLFPSLAQSDQKRRGELLGQTLYIYVVLASLIYGLIFLLAPSLISLVYGSKWLPCVPILQILVFSIYGGATMNFLGSALIATGNAALPARIDWLTSIFSILAYVIGVSLNGIYGVAIGSLIVVGIAAPSWYWFSTYKFSDLDISISLNYIKTPLISFLLSLALISVTTYYFSMLFTAIAQAIVFVLMYFLMLTLMTEKVIKQRIYNIVCSKF